MINIKNLEIARAKSGLNKKEVAFKCEIGERTFLNIYKSDKDIYLSTVIKIAKALDTSISFLVGEDTNITNDIQVIKDENSKLKSDLISVLQSQKSISEIEELLEKVKILNSED